MQSLWMQSSQTVTVCWNVLQGQLYWLLHTSGNDSHMYLLGSLTVLWNRFGQSEDHPARFVYHILSSDPLQNGRVFLDEYLKTQ